MGPKLLTAAEGRLPGLLPGSHVGWRSKPPGDPLESAARCSRALIPSLLAEPSLPCPPYHARPRPRAPSLPLRRPPSCRGPAQSWLLQPSRISSLPRAACPVGSGPHTRSRAVVLSKVFWTLPFGKCTCGRAVPHDPKHNLEGGTPSPGPFRAPTGKPSEHTVRARPFAVYGSQMSALRKVPAQTSDLVWFTHGAAPERFLPSSSCSCWEASSSGAHLTGQFGSREHCPRTTSGFLPAGPPTPAGIAPLQAQPGFTSEKPPGPRAFLEGLTLSDRGFYLHSGRGAHLAEVSDLCAAGTRVLMAHVGPPAQSLTPTGPRRDTAG